MRSHMTIQLSFDLKLTATRHPLQASARLAEVKELPPAKELNPAIPAEARVSVKTFRLWLAQHDGLFDGGEKDLFRLMSKLPPRPHLGDLLAAEDPSLRWQH
jgi:hypothetical protein